MDGFHDRVIIVVVYYDHMISSLSCQILIINTVLNRQSECALDNNNLSPMWRICAGVKVSPGKTFLTLPWGCSRTATVTLKALFCLGRKKLKCNLTCLLIPHWGGVPLVPFWILSNWSHGGASLTCIVRNVPPAAEGWKTIRTSCFYIPLICRSTSGRFLTLIVSASKGERGLEDQ